MHHVLRQEQNQRLVHRMPPQKQVLVLPIVRNDHKICTMLNVTDMEAFETITTETKMTEWDAANNCVDTIYSLEKFG